MQNIFTLGYYLYAESSWPRKQGDKARIASRNLMQTTATYPSYCLLRFYYHLLGDHIGRLNVYSRQCQGKGCPERLHWTTNTTAGNRWVRREVRISSNKPFQVLLLVTYHFIISANTVGDERRGMKCLNLRQ